MYISIAIILLFIIMAFWILNLPVFGRHPQGKRQDRLQELPYYKDGELINLSPTPMKPDEISYWTMIRKFVEGNKHGTPSRPLPHMIPDLVPGDSLKITWFGHSSYLIQVRGKSILVDPVFSDRTSPFQFLGTKRFEGTDFIGPEDFPFLDMIVITHDHYDHLDYETIGKLKSKTKHFITALGVGAYLEYWGVPEAQITELAWWENATLFNDFHFTAAPARHFSGRGIKRNQTLWASFILKTQDNTIYIGGDSGYDQHFKEVGEKYGPFDVAILECGQYNNMWPLIHMFPEEVAQAAVDLRATVLMPVHWGKFRLAIHAWDEPIKRLMIKSRVLGLTVATPMLGQSFSPHSNLHFKAWWEGL